MAATSLAPMRRSTPTAGLEILAYFMPLDLCILKDAALAHIRVTAIIKSKWNGLPKRGEHLGHLQWQKNWNEKNGIVAEHSDGIIPVHCWEKQYQVDIINMDGGTPLLGEDITVYTDGSKMRGHLGFGFYIEQRYGRSIKESRSLGTHTTVYQAELHAIKAAAETLADLNGRSVVINSDSQSALQALDSPVATSQLVLDTKKALNSAVKRWGKCIKLRWVKAHVGHPGNEIADQLAKQGSSDPATVAEPNILLPSSSWKLVLREIIEKLWSKRFKSMPECRQTKLWTKTPDLNRSKALLKLSRQEVGDVIQFVTGHAHLRRHDSLIDPSVSPLCRLCQEDDESPWHLAMECMATAESRFDAFGVENSTEISDQWKVNQVGRFARTVMARLSSSGLE